MSRLRSASITIRDVARAARVSIATVSATINRTAYVSPALQERVRKAIAEVGYHPDAIARSLKRRATQTLGLVISDITNPFFTALVRGIEDAATARGHAVILCNTDERLDKERAYLELLRSRRIDGLILAPAGAVADYHRFFIEANTPLVFIDRKIPTIPADVVVVDNVTGARQAVAHLVGLGHRRIGAISGLPQISTTHERIAGYRQALEAAGVPADPALLRDGHSRLDGGERAAGALLELPVPPTAIFATNNLMAIGLMRAVAARGLRCPEDLSVACFDDFEWASVFRPRLTTVAQPTYEMGARAVELLFGRLEGSLSGPPREVVLAPTLVVRDSCGPPPGGLR
ncbi:MAG TPA: LacI family DNA-binding transcriptional regulator [Methylomirabilota bacterium]|jgi:LacI family transcriptional regulator|nr:LacI family DNA-binding transcriptional regulator [Methylomirabilota bacterium]